LNRARFDPRSCAVAANAGDIGGDMIGSSDDGSLSEEGADVAMTCDLARRA
jgi:hypothetical protein